MPIAPGAPSAHTSTVGAPRIFRFGAPRKDVGDLPGRSQRAIGYRNLADGCGVEPLLHRGRRRSNHLGPGWRYGDGHRNKARFGSLIAVVRRIRPAGQGEDVSHRKSVNRENPKPRKQENGIPISPKLRPIRNTPSDAKPGPTNPALLGSSVRVLKEHWTPKRRTPGHARSDTPATSQGTRRRWCLGVIFRTAIRPITALQ